MSDGKAHNFGYEVINDFNVSIPFCAGELDRAWQRRGAELGRGEERSLAEARSGAWQRRGAELGRGEEWTEVLKSWMACALPPGRGLR